jgi:hypothetical protein
MKFIYIICKNSVSTDEVIRFLNWPDPFSRTMALGSTQPLTEMTGIFLGGKWGPAHRAENLTPICEQIVYKNVGASTSDNPMSLQEVFTGMALPIFLFPHRNKHGVKPAD